MQLSRIETAPLCSTDIMFAIEKELIPIEEILQESFNRVETKASAMWAVYVTQYANMLLVLCQKKRVFCRLMKRDF